MRLKLGLNPWNQRFGWQEYQAVARTAERLGYDHLWSWDHLVSVMGGADLDVHEPYVLLSAWSQLTSSVKLGVLVTANTFRHPGVLAKTITSLDHVSGGRAILGMGAAWHATEHREFGIHFGEGLGERLDWLDESVSALRALFDGDAVFSPEGGHYHFSGARLHPVPLQEHLPILIGGAGERWTLGIVARRADIWNMTATSDLDLLRRKDSVLRRWCRDVGRDQSEIERSLFIRPVVRGTKAEANRFSTSQMKVNGLDADYLNHPSVFVTSTERMSELVIGWVELGFSTLIVESASPFDEETAEIFADEIRPIIGST